jgi:tetratricopeptide (TPR) repeat protein
MPRCPIACVVVAAALSLLPRLGAAQGSQPDWRAENLQYFPKDISRATLTQRMREFSFALGVRCQYCHTGGNGISFEGVSFSSDEKPAKVKARAMLRMVDQLNHTMLAQLPSRAEPRVDVDCATCHRGMALPKSLQTTLIETIDRQGIPAAVAQYRELRQNTLVSGRYNFGEWEVNELARRLSESKKTDAAIAMLELNGEFNPKSADIDVLLGELHRGRGDRDKAIQRYRSALEKAPQHPMAKQRLTELEKNPQ